MVFRFTDHIMLAVLVGGDFRATRLLSHDIPATRPAERGPVRDETNHEYPPLFEWPTKHTALAVLVMQTSSTV